MSDLDIIKACTDLGVHKNGADLGPEMICKNINLTHIQHVYEVKKENCIKEQEKENKKKNITAINHFNETLYHTVYQSIVSGNVPLTIGGDHSLAIGSCLASKKYCDNIGLVWFDAHGDYHTFETTVTGNIHGLPFACITGQNGMELNSFFDGNFFNPQKCVLLGARSIDYPGEYINLKKAGVKIFDTDDIKKRGVENVFHDVIQIVTDGTYGFHLSIDTDVMDPETAPGVSVPEPNGISSKEFMKMIQLFMEYHEKIKSIDFVEYNPNYDVHHQTLKIITNTIDGIIKTYANQEEHVKYGLKRQMIRQPNL